MNPGFLTPFQRQARVTLVMAVFIMAVAPLTRLAADDAEFFEKRIRPLLIEKCHKCHSTQSEKLKGGLKLDSRDALIKGGDTGPALVPGSPEKSLLIKAVGYEDKDLQMPPKAKLGPQEIADLTAWVKSGAPWTEEPAAASNSAAQKKSVFDLAKRRASHWVWQPIRAVTPPKVRQRDWPANAVDNFVLAKLETAGLKPAPPADSRTLIRRIYFDLVGLPPPPAEVEAFVRDASAANRPSAIANLVDRLLDSSQFGERWARHWFDRVRYCETMGHEFDFPILAPWRYRDYVIRAINADLPYDRFIAEHVAGDLFSDPRRGEHGWNESLLGTTFFWFSQQCQAPVDVRAYQADLIDNQIDVLSKAFLGLTVACARCHDHKFDAISTRDYYSLYGVLENSRYGQRALNDDAIIEMTGELVSLKKTIRERQATVWERDTEFLSKYLLAAQGLEQAVVPDEARLERWKKALASDELNAPSHPLHAWCALKKAASLADAWNTLARGNQANDPAEPDASAVEFSDFKNWLCDGLAFGNSPAPPGEFVLSARDDSTVARFVRPGTVDSALLSRRLHGALRSPTFIIAKRYLHLLAAGLDSRINIVLENFTIIRDPIYGTLKQSLKNETPRWITIDLNMWQGRHAYIELADNPTADPAGPSYGENGWLALEHAVFSDNKTPPTELTAHLPNQLLGETPPASLHALAERYAEAVREALSAWHAGALDTSAKSSAQIALLDWLVRHRLLDERGDGSLRSASTQFHQLESQLPAPVFIAAMTDGNGFDERVFIRGNHRTLGETATRRFLEASSTSQSKPFASGSGRLELARALTDPANPLPARVMANNVWHHLLGRGIVPTVDNFGVLGERPSHPELLDWLAAEFQRNGWSTKKLIRLVMLSRTYQMSSSANDKLAEEKDASNMLLHRGNVRRLEGEAIRDAMLAVSGRLDAKMFGEPVPVHLTPFMDGRGRPSESGPLDGNGRRSIYISVRRNFIAPMMLAFDTPLPASTVGRRSVSNVPAQALILMNDPFVLQQAGVWAKRVSSGGGATPAERVRGIYLAAFSREPNESEMNDALAFVETQANAYEPGKDGEQKAWADFCHVIFNTKEFIFLN